MRVTASDIVSAVSRLPRDRAYHYVNPRTAGQIHIVRTDGPEGPIIIKRFNPSQGETLQGAREESISTQLLWRVANAFRENQPISLDRVLGASYNTRSVLEALLAHTPQFYFCYPGRVEDINGKTEIKSGHKHLVWRPDLPHTEGVLQEMETDMVISEVPNMEAFYDALVVPDEIATPGLDIETQRRHIQIQIALVMIGKQLGFRTWIAQNDLGIIYQGTRLGEMEGVLSRLDQGNVLAAFPEAVRAARLIDSIWFQDTRFMPAVMEVEHTTGITSGLTRMKGLQDNAPALQTRFVIVAPDEDRPKAIREANREQFLSLNAKFFPYSAVEELYALCQRRKIRGVSQDFIESFMEPMVGQEEE